MNQFTISICAAFWEVLLLAKEKSKLQQLKETYCILCEGTTEFNYFTSIKEKISASNTNIKLKIVNMEGGGYSNIFKEITKLGKVGYLAVFVIFDGDKAENPNEKIQLEKLINSCKKRNSNNSVFPCCLIVNSPDFEYIACLHDSNYKGNDPAAYLKKILDYGDLEKFKSDTSIYEKLNRDPLSYKNMLNKLEIFSKIVWNKYAFETSKEGIKKISIRTSYDPNAIRKNGSNIKEIFDILHLTD